MLYDAKTPEEYLEVLEDDWRKEKLSEVRALIKKNGPGWVEGIDYKMLSYKYKGNIIFCLNAQKDYVSFYVGDIDKVENGRRLLKEFNMGKGCIRIKKSLDLHSSNLGEFITNTVDVWEKGGETDC